MKTEQTDAIAAKFIDQLAKGTVPWRKPWSPAPGIALHNYNSKRPYRGINTLLLAIEQIDKQYSSPAWTTYNGALKALGWDGEGGRAGAAAWRAANPGKGVRKGEKGTHIVLWKPIQVDDKTTGEKKQVWFSRLFSVFNTDQIDGIDWEAPDLGEPLTVPAALDSIVDGYRNGPSIRHEAQDRAFYSPARDEIILPLLEQFDTVEGYAETLCHELVHSTGHSTRLGRFDRDDIGCQASYAKEELVAEIGASLLAQGAGISLDIEQTAAYVGGWLKALNDDHGLIVKAAQQAQKAVDRIVQQAASVEEQEDFADAA